MQTNVKICNNYDVCTASYKIRIAYDYDIPVFIVAESKELCSVTDNRATRIVSHLISFETK